MIRIVLTLACVATFAGVPTLAALPKIKSNGPAASQSGGGLLEGLDGLLEQSAADNRGTSEAAEQADRQTPQRGAEGPAWLPNQKELKQRMKQGIDGQPAMEQFGEDLGESPLVTLRGSMDRAGRLIAKGDDGRETRPAQEGVVKQLDELIKQMEKACKNCQNSSSSQQQQQQSRRSKPSQPKESEQAEQQPAKQQANKPGAANSRQAANESSLRQSQAQAATAKESQRRAELVKQVWGRLPERLREQMLQSTSDEYLPEYRDEIEQYFERLAEEEE